jgi:hypothetical protein
MGPWGRSQAPLQLSQPGANANQGGLQFGRILLGLFYGLGGGLGGLKGHIAHFHLDHRIAKSWLEIVQAGPQLGGGRFAFFSQGAEGIGAGAIEGGHHLPRAPLAGPFDNGQAHGQQVLHQGETQGIKGIGGHWRTFKSSLT